MSTSKRHTCVEGAVISGSGGREREIAIETISAFAAADMNITTAASALHVHPNTVRYRLARIADTTGLDPRTFSGLADLHCIIELQP